MKIFFIKSVKWIAAYLSCVTMVFAPVALGKEVENLNKKYLQQALKELGLDKKTTLGKFWDRSKASIPRYIYHDLEEFVKNNRNLLMPEATLAMSKATDGTEVPVIYFSQNGKVHTVQIYGEKNKWAKFNSVTLSRLDLERVDDAFKRIEASDIKIKTEANKFRKSRFAKQHSSLLKFRTSEYKKDFSRFKGFPRITPQMWASMSKEERAGFIVKMRLLWISAKKVRANGVSSLKQNKDSKKTASSIDAYKNFVEIVFGPNAEAAAAATKKASGPYNANNCLAAGYTTVYDKVDNVSGSNRDGCSIDKVSEFYSTKKEFKFILDANKTCSSTNKDMIACNPIIYGFPGGKEICISKKAAGMQQATHYAGPCDTQSPLTTDKLFEFTGKDYSNIQPRSSQIEAIEADQKNDYYALTKSFLSGALKKNDPTLQAIFEKGEWTLALDQELVRIQSQFEEEIDNAIRMCEAGITDKHEKNQKSACDQLHRRWLFTEREIAKLRAKACLKPAVYVGVYGQDEDSYSNSGKKKTEHNKKSTDAKGTGLCKCENGKLTNFNTPCETDVPVLNAVPAIEGEETTTCDKPEGIAEFDYKACKCEDNKKLKSNKDGTYECEGSNWKPWAIAGGAIAGLVGLFALLNRDKDSKNQVSQPPPVPSCVAPKVGLAPNCICPVPTAICTVSQQIYDQTTCQCTNVPQPVICPDGTVAPNSNVANCPVVPPATEGGNGNSCPQGGCSGGLPTVPQQTGQ